MYARLLFCYVRGEAFHLPGEIPHSNSSILSQIGGDDIMGAATGYVSIFILVSRPFLLASPTIPNVQSTKRQLHSHLSTTVEDRIRQSDTMPPTLLPRHDAAFKSLKTGVI